MKHRYTGAQLLKHARLYPLRYAIPMSRRVGLWRHVLARQNSVPLYLVVQRGDTVVQVGTPNIHTIRRLARLVGPAGLVIVIEADPGNSSRLEVAARTLRGGSIRIVNRGAWSSEGTMNLRLSDEFDGDHRFELPGVHVDNDLRTSYSNDVEVRMSRLDTMLEELNVRRVNYLAVTVNGVELEVLKGASRLLSESTDLRVFAKGHARIGRADSEITLNSSIQSYLEERGFTTVKSRGEMSPTGEALWGRRAGDVFAWKASP